MKGIVLDYSTADQRGLIRGEDGERYVFSGDEIKGSGALKAGASVDFDKDGTEAKAIYSVAASGISGSQSLDAGKEAAQKVNGLLKSGKIKRFISGGFDTVCQIFAVLLPVIMAISGFLTGGALGGYQFHIGYATLGLVVGLISGVLTSLGVFGLLFTLIETRDAAKRTVELLEKESKS